MPVVWDKFDRRDREYTEKIAPLSSLYRAKREVHLMYTVLSEINKVTVPGIDGKPEMSDFYAKFTVR